MSEDTKNDTVMTIVEGYENIGKCMVVSNPKYIPRIGETIYTDSRSKVVNVIYKYSYQNEDRIDVITERY